MYNLTNNPILLPHQITILQLFFSTPFAKPFFLTGGTCLSAFYLAHRESQDLDFFSLSPFDSLALKTTIQEIADKTHAGMSIQARSQTYSEIYLENAKEEWRQKREFWWKIDLSEYLEPSDLQPSAFPNLKPTTQRITMRVPSFLLNRLKTKANELDVPYQSLIKQAIDRWLKLT